MRLHAGEEALQENQKRAEKKLEETAGREKIREFILNQLKIARLGSIFQATEQAIAPFAGDRDFMLEAVKVKPESFRLANGALLSDRDFVSKAFETTLGSRYEWVIFRYGDPAIVKDKKAKFIERISWKRFYKIANKTKFKAGQHFVLDQKASKIIKKYKIKTYIIGENVNNITGILNDKSFEGTLISG